MRPDGNERCENMENKRLKDCDIHELAQEIRNRDEVIGVIVWIREDIESGLKDKGFIPTEERIDEVEFELGNSLEDCSSGWEIIQTAIWNCDFGDCDYEEE